MGQAAVWRGPIAAMPVGFGAATVDEDNQVHFRKLTPEELDMKLIDETLSIIKTRSKASVDKVVKFKETVDVQDSIKEEQKSTIEIKVEN